MPKLTRDYTHWLTKQQVAQLLTVSEKTVEKLAADKKLEQGTRTRPGKPPLRVYNPDDVERVRLEREPQIRPFVMPSEASAVTQVAQRVSIPEALPPLLEGMRLPQARVRLSEKIYLTIREASEYSGFTQAHLLRLIKDGQLKAVRDVSLKVRRSDLEKL